MNVVVFIAFNAFQIISKVLGYVFIGMKGYRRNNCKNFKCRVKINLRANKRKYNKLISEICKYEKSHERLKYQRETWI